MCGWRWNWAVPQVQIAKCFCLCTGLIQMLVLSQHDSEICDGLRISLSLNRHCICHHLVWVNNQSIFAENYWHHHCNPNNVNLITRKFCTCISRDCWFMQNFFVIELIYMIYVTNLKETLFNQIWNLIKISHHDVSWKIGGIEVGGHLRWCFFIDCFDLEDIVVQVLLSPKSWLALNESWHTKTWY